MKRPQPLLVLLLIGIHQDCVQAEDGYGLGQVIDWILFLILFSCAVLVFRHGFFPKGQTSSPGRRIFAGSLAALLVFPIVVTVLSPYFVRALCSVNASLVIGAEPKDWSPPSPGTAPRNTSRRNDRGENETNTVPGLLDYFDRSGGTLGVWKVTQRLVDQSTGKELISATFYGGKLAGRFDGCDVAWPYHLLREQFKEKAMAAASR